MYFCRPVPPPPPACGSRLPGVVPGAESLWPTGGKEMSLILSIFTEPSVPLESSSCFSLNYTASWPPCNRQHYWVEEHRRKKTKKHTHIHKTTITLWRYMFSCPAWSCLLKKKETTLLHKAPFLTSSVSSFPSRSTSREKSS